MKHIGQLRIRLTHEEWLALLFALICFVAALGMMTIAEARPRASLATEAPTWLADVVPEGTGGAGGSSDAGGSGGAGGSSNPDYSYDGNQTAPEGEYDPTGTKGTGGSGTNGSGTNGSSSTGSGTGSQGGGTNTSGSSSNSSTSPNATGSDGTGTKGTPGTPGTSGTSGTSGSSGSNGSNANERYPQTGAFPLILTVFGIGVALAVVWFALTMRKPKKLGGSKGDVW